MDCLQALPYTECLSGISFPVPMAHLAAQKLPEQINHCLEYSLESSLNVYLDAVPNSRFRAFHRLLTGSMSSNEAIELFRRKRQLQNLIYKEPFFSFAPKFIQQALPKSKIIYLVRDGRDCANSLVKSYDVLTDEKLKGFRTSESPFGYMYQGMCIPWWVEGDQASDFLEASPYVRAIWMWKEMVKCCDRFFCQDEVISNGRVLQISYEDLAREPITVGEKISKHLGVQTSDRFIKNLQKASPKSIGKYKTRDPLEVKSAEQVAYDELKFHNYLV
ncbi:sulfotransferase [Leptolyngbya sp. SLC-A1]